MNRTHPFARLSARRLQLCAALLTAVAAIAAHSASASASTGQIAIIQDGNALKADPAGAMTQFRELGATTIRLLVFWKDVAPSPNSRKAPKNFKASNPSSYPGWAPYDAIVTEARTQGLKVDLDLTGPPPNWAQGSGVPQYAINKRFGWRPNAGYYGSFVRAAATRYDGSFKPKGEKKALPKVSLWSLWNEPNFGQDLGPGSVGATSKSVGYDVAAGYYRNLVRKGYSALKADSRLKGITILIGELAGQGAAGVKTKSHPQGLPGNYAITSPLPFIQTLYCVDTKYQRLTGTAAKQAQCPTTASAAGSFRKDNAGLFDASAVSSHPYASTFKPDATTGIGAQAIILPVINRLESAMQKSSGHYGVRRNWPIYSTEYGFVTSPPQRGGQGYFSPSTAAEYLNEAEYMSYKNPNVRSFAQYLLKDPPNQLTKHVGLFSSGLLTDKNKAKPAFNAYRLPLWMPHQSVKRNSSAEVWGGARPAFAAYAAVKSAQKVRIQLQTNGRGSFKTLSTVTASKSNGYFDTHIKLPSSGKLRLQYSYPKLEPFLPMGIEGSTVVSRSINVSVH